MMNSDFNILLASTGMLHSSASFNAMAAGIPSICMDGGMTLEMFQSGAVTDDMKMIALRKHYVVEERLRAGSEDVPRHLAITAPTSPIASMAALPVRRCRARDFDPYKIINFAKDENRPGNNLLYYLFPDRRVQRRPGRGQRQWQARHRPHHASSSAAC